MSIEEAVAEVRSTTNPALATKRLQDLAQSYGCERNLSMIVLRFHNAHSNHKILNRSTRFSVQANKVEVS